MQTQPYLFFEGLCDEALSFYRYALGAEAGMIMRFGESPEPGSMPPDKVMHMSMRIGDTEILASDGNCTGRPDFKGFSLVLTPSTDAEARRIFDALADGGTVSQPLIKTFFSSNFGMVNDRFGVPWMVYVKA